MTNPNANPDMYFAYDLFHPASSAAPPVNDGTLYVAISWRRNEQVAYTANIDTNKWIYMNLDTGEIFKSSYF